MIIPHRNEILLKIYRCPICKNIYRAQTGGSYISCLVNHPPGSCCHHWEHQLEERKVEQIMSIVKGDGWRIYD